MPAPETKTFAYGVIMQGEYEGEVYYSFDGEMQPSLEAAMQEAWALTYRYNTPVMSIIRMNVITGRVETLYDRAEAAWAIDNWRREQDAIEEDARQYRNEIARGTYAPRRL